MSSNPGTATAPVLIVSTGRCGSTLLSNIVRIHPRLLSVSEFFTSLSTAVFRGRRMDGEAVYRRLNTLSHAGRAVLEAGLEMEEFLYKFGPGARYTPSNVPPIMCSTMPHLSDQPEQLWDELAADLRTRGVAPLEEQYRFVFEWLVRRFDRATWVERSGGSLPLVPVLARLFPDARFVHIYRDGRDTALSMQRHPYFRLRVKAYERLRGVGLDPFSAFNLPGVSPWAPLAEYVQFRLLFSAKRYHAMQIPLPGFGRFWSDMILCGLRHLAELPPSRVHTIRYERLTAAPRQEIERFARFVGSDFADTSWLEEAAKLPRDRPAPWRSLPSAEAELLTKACLPGQQLLDKLDSGLS